MLTTFEQLKTFYNALIQKIKGFKGNWNQNDPAADDYIKGRTHYSEVKHVELFSSDSVVIEYDSAELSVSQHLVKGQEYTIIVNNTEYNLTSRFYDIWGSEVIGNLERLGGDSDGIDEDVPFAIEFYEGQPEWGVWFYADAGTHSVSIQGDIETVHKIDEKFIPLIDGVKKFGYIEGAFDDNASIEDFDALDSFYVCITDNVIETPLAVDTRGRLGLAEVFESLPVSVDYRTISADTFTEQTYSVGIPRVAGKNLCITIVDSSSATRQVVWLGRACDGDNPSNAEVLESMFTINGFIFLLSIPNININEDSQTITYTLKKLGKATDVQYLDGVTSNVQEQLDGKASTAVASTSANGLMSSTDKAKVDTLPETIADTTYTTARYRASSLHSTETTPTTNGVIAWMYE